MDQDTSQNGDGERADLLRGILGAGQAAEDDVLRMAREAGGMPYRNRFVDGTAFAFGPEALERFAALVRADEREKCAQMCEDTFYGDAGELNHELASAIRARSDQ